MKFNNTIYDSISYDELRTAIKIKEDATDFDVANIECIGGPVKVYAHLDQRNTHNSSNAEAHILYCYSQGGVSLEQEVKGEAQYNAAIQKAVAHVGGVGKIVFAEYRGENRRMYINRVSFSKAVTMKHGWWDTFTLVEDGHIPSENGIWACRLTGYQHDAHDFLMAIVQPIAKISDLNLARVMLYHEMLVGRSETDNAKAVHPVYSIGADAPRKADRFGFTIAANTDWVPNYDWSGLYSRLQSDHEVDISDIESDILARLYSKSAKEVLAENDYKNAKLLIRQNPVVAKYAERWAANRFERYINYTAFMEDCRGEFERLWHESGGIVGGENAFDYSYEKVVLTVCEEAEKVRAQYKAKSKAKKAEKIAAKKAVKKAAREAAAEG